MAGNVSAKPAGFVLKMRLVASDGTPFFRKWFRVKWGEKLIPPPSQPPLQTGRHGELSVLLEAPMARTPQGYLRVVDRDGPTETVRWTIPIQVAEEVVSGFPVTERAPTPPPEPTPSQDSVEDYEKRLIKHKVKIVQSLRERMTEFWGEWDDVRPYGGPNFPLKPQIGASDDEMWEAWRNFLQAFALKLHGYESAWRLWNMADLPLDDVPQVEFLIAQLEQLVRAMERFAMRQGLPSPFSIPVEATVVETVLNQLKTVHDQRGKVVPVPEEAKP
ncbi:MAG: hypothetical protein IPK82_43990 [Polyangiaceae bacterium]|nr:hypothetical protein [Polyangiaceae bacterium]